MKKIMFVISLMAISLLASCNSNKGLGTPKPLEECSWGKINQVSKAGKASEWFKVGDTKKLQLKHQDTNNNRIIDDGELYQTVRIIGINEDYTELPTDGSKPNPNKAIGITFEFVDLISDANGYSLATQWNDTNDISTANNNYLNSSIRYALNKKTGTDGCDHILWAQKEATEWSNYYINKSELDKFRPFFILSVPFFILNNDLWFFFLSNFLFLRFSCSNSFMMACCISFSV